MNIFFAGAIRGGRADQPHYSHIVKMLNQYGMVLSAHVADESISSYGETDLSKEEIHDRELASLQKSDVVVADVSTPSLGVGYLINEAARLNKRIVCLYGGTNTYKLSAMIKGNKNVGIHTYKTDEDIEKILIEELG